MDTSLAHPAQSSVSDCEPWGTPVAHGGGDRPIYPGKGYRTTFKLKRRQLPRWMSAIDFAPPHSEIKAHPA